MNPREFLDLADEWSAGSREGEWRSAVSRAYYAAFHVARSLFLHCGFSVPPGDQAHGYQMVRLANAGHPDVQRVGNNLNDLRRVRNQADYDLSTSFTQRNSINYV